MDGSRSFASFNVGRELGRGGMGVVYVAELDGREVALKVAAADIPERERKNFVAEAELMARVAHPSVVELLDSGLLEDGRPYLVMPLLHGETLGARLVRGRLPVDFALRMFVQLAGAVSALHEAGIVHRDIKPENVMLLEEEERVVLLDLGIARETSQPASTTTRMNLVRGTPACMAPERFFGTRATPASDVYELTVVLYAMLTSALPWAEATDPESRLRPRHPSEIGVTLPVGLGHLLIEGLASRPDRRPSLRELTVRARELEGSAMHELSAPQSTVLQMIAPMPVLTPAAHARSIAPPRTTDTSRRRAFGGVAGAWRVALVLAVGALGAGSAWRLRHPPSRVVEEPSSMVTRDRGSSTPMMAAVAGAPERPRDEPPPSEASPTVSAVASATATSDATAPRTTVTSSAASSVPSAPSVPSSTASPAGPTKAGTEGNGAACARLVELYCTPESRATQAGAARCADHRAALARMKDLPAKLQAESDAHCRESIPAVARAIQGAGRDPAEDMPYCKQLVALACSAEAKATPAGASYCVSVERGFYTGHLGAAPEARAAHDADCARSLPSIAMVVRSNRADAGGGRSP